MSGGLPEGTAKLQGPKRRGALLPAEGRDLAGDAGGPFRPPSRSRGLLLGHVAFPRGALLSSRHRGRARPTEADGLGLRAGHLAYKAPEPPTKMVPGVRSQALRELDPVRNGI